MIVVLVLIAAGVVLDAGFAPSGLPAGTSLASFEASVRRELVSSKTRGGLGVQGVASVTCVLPARWKPGASFSCLAFRADDVELGSVAGVVRVANAGQPWRARLEWNAGA